MQKFSTHPLLIPLRTLFVIFVVSLLCSQLSSCGMARMAYNNGESISWFWLDRYVDFRDDQRPWVKKEIASLFAWHRRTQLPAYVAVLQKAQQRVQRPVTEGEVRADYDLIQSRLLQVAEQALPSLAELALSLRPEQLVHLERRFASNNEDYRKENLRGDLEQRQRDRYKKALKQAEYFFGDLSHEQEERLRALSNARPLNNELVLRDHKRRQQEMLAMLRKIQTEKPDKDTTIKLLRNYLKGALDHFGNAEHKAYYDAYRAATIHQITELINHTTPAQKQHFNHVLQQWIDDFKRLSAQPPGDNVGKAPSEEPVRF